VVRRPAPRDADLLGSGDPSTKPMLVAFREIANIAADDGLTFGADALRVDLIREELEDGGLRRRMSRLAFNTRPDDSDTPFKLQGTVSS
jgi:hypothetical protein